MIQDWWYSFIYWVEDNLQIVLSVLLVIGFVTVMWIMMSGDDTDDYKFIEGVKKDTLEEVEAVKELTEDIDEVFSLLAERQVGIHEKYPAYEVDIYLKKPFIDEEDFKKVIRDYIEIYKWKDSYNLSGIKIKVYDRKEVYDKDLKPRAEIYYFKKLTEDKLLTEDEGGSRLYGDAVMDENFLDTIDIDKPPNYDGYDLRINDFQPLNISKSLIPLTDQEFSFYLKMDMYHVLLGGNKYGGAKLYLQWDLGKDVYRDGIVAIEREFNNFYKRHLDIGGQVNYYENQLILKQQLAIEKPQFLLFALTNKLYDDPLDAQRELIKEDPDLYKRILEENIDKQVEETFKEDDGEDKGESGNVGEEDESVNESEEYIDFEQE